MLEAQINITLKKTVSDPQGQTIKHALVSLNFDKLSNVRIGKYVVINIEGNDKKKAEEDVKDMCKKLLANPIIEDYSFQIREI